jgi:putative phosphoribosyl transferase
VAAEVAHALDAPLDVVVVRKLHAPEQPELGLGAIVDGDHPETVLNERLIRVLGVSEAYLAGEIAAQLDEVRRRERRFRRGRPAEPLAGRTVIVVDDGIATGSTVRAALRGIRRARPARLVLAVPVAPPDTVAALRGEVDELVCLETPEDFAAVGRFYADFRQTTDGEVETILARAARARARPAFAATE